MSRYSKEELFEIRNFIPIRFVIEELLAIPGKDIEGVFRFLCPSCGEFQTGINPNSNLSRCFRCARNFNVIDLVMVDSKRSFLQSVEVLQKVRKALLVCAEGRPGPCLPKHSPRPH